MPLCKYLSLIMLTMLVDFSNLSYASAFGFKNSTYELNLTQGVLCVLQVSRRLHVDRLIFCLDTPRIQPSPRFSIYPEYKAGRATHLPSEAVSFSMEFVSKLPVFVAFAPYFEADDCIAFLTKAAMRSGSDVLIWSNDRDMFQFLTDKKASPKVLQTKSLGSNVEYWDASSVMETFGVSPQNVPIMKALCSDPSDNIKGIRGLRKDVAASLISYHGTLENILADLDSAQPSGRHFLTRSGSKVTDAFYKNYLSSRDILPINLRLATAPFDSLREEDLQVVECKLDSNYLNNLDIHGNIFSLPQYADYLMSIKHPLDVSQFSAQFKAPDVSSFVPSYFNSDPIIPL